MMSEVFYIISTKYGKKVNENRYDVQGQTLNTVVMYDVKTGRIKMLFCFNHKMLGCTAVITGNVIVVVGGYINAGQLCGELGLKYQCMENCHQ